MELTRELMSWGGSLAIAAVGGVGSTLWWAMRRHITRVDEHEARITTLEQGKVGRDELERAIERLEDAHQRCAEQTNERLDRIYDLMVQAARGHV